MKIFLVYAGLSVLLITLLAMNVSRLRMREKVANGDGGNKLVLPGFHAHYSLRKPGLREHKAQS